MAFSSSSTPASPSRPKVSDLDGIARQPRLVVLLAAEILPNYVLRPARHDFFVGQIEKACFKYRSEAISRIGKRGRPAALTPPPAISRFGPKMSSPSMRCPSRFDLPPGQPLRQGRQRMPNVDHLLQLGTGKIVAFHGVLALFLSGFSGYFSFPEFYTGKIFATISVRAGYGVCRDDSNNERSS
jgi:hypothetical protein